MAQNEPGIPLFPGDKLGDEEKKENDNPEKGNSNANNAGKDDKSGQSEETIEQVKQAHAEQVKKLEEAWNEDREYFQGEIKRLRSEERKPKLTAKEEEELEGLDEDERVEKLIEFRQKRKELADKAELEAVKSEIRFYERTSTEFAENKQAILKVARDYDCPGLKQAILIWRGLNIKQQKTEQEINNQRKKEGDGKGGGNSGGETKGKAYDRKEHGNKSFGQLYSERGL